MRCMHPMWCLLCHRQTPHCLHTQHVIWCTPAVYHSSGYFVCNPDRGLFVRLARLAPCSTKPTPKGSKGKGKGKGVHALHNTPLSPILDFPPSFDFDKPPRSGCGIVPCADDTVPPRAMLFQRRAQAWLAHVHAHTHAHIHAHTHHAAWCVVDQSNRVAAHVRTLLGLTGGVSVVVYAAHPLWFSLSFSLTCSLLYHALHIFICARGLSTGCGVSAVIRARSRPPVLTPRAIKVKGMRRKGGSSVDPP